MAEVGSPEITLFIGGAVAPERRYPESRTGGASTRPDAPAVHLFSRSHGAHNQIGGFDGTDALRLEWNAAIQSLLALSGRVIGVAWYRFRATLHQRQSSYLAIVLLVGLVGGVAMGALAGARRSQSTFPAFLAATNASDLQVQVYNVSGLAVADLTEKLAHLPLVNRVGRAPYLLLDQLGPKGMPLAGAANTNEVQELGSDGGMYFTQDRVTVVQGRMADPRRADEMVATAAAAKISGWHVGESVPFGAYTLQQAQAPGFDLQTAKPAGERFSAKLVGLVVFSSQVVNDDVDRFPANVLMTPTLTGRLRDSGAFPTYGLRLTHGSGDVATVEREIIRLLPPGHPYVFHVTSVTEGQVKNSHQARGDRPRCVWGTRCARRPADRWPGHQPGALDEW